MIVRRLAHAAAGLLLLASPGSGDRVLVAPDGGVLPPGGIRYEAAAGIGSERAGYQWIQLGIPHAEVQAVLENPAHGESAWGFGLQVEVLPESFFLPGLSVGVRDVTDETRQGRAYYAAAAKSLEAPAPISRFAETIGVAVGLGGGDMRGLFGSIALQTPWKARLLIEHDSRRFNAGVEMPVTDWAALRASSIGGEAYVGISLTFGDRRAAAMGFDLDDF